MNRTSTSQTSGKTSAWLNLLLTSAILLLFLLMGQKMNAQPCANFACKSSINVSLDQNGQAGITPAMIMATTVGCPGLGTVVLMDQNNNPIGNTVNCSMVGKTYQAKLNHQYGNSCWSNVKVEDKLGPKLTCVDKTVTCLELPSITTAMQPTAVDNCTPVSNFNFSDQTMNFACGNLNVTGFNGPFEMWMWKTCLPNGGNGTVDQSLMPNQITLIGAFGQPIKTNPRYITQYKVTATNFGYVKFDWMMTGDGNPNVDAFYFTVNDSCVQLSKTNVLMGTYTSWYIKPGDVISFELASDGDMWFNKVKINNFQFTGDIQTMITRTWTASDANGNTGSCVQNIKVKRISNGSVIFPKDLNDIAAPSLECGKGTDPDQTGYPLYDQDGNLSTTADQIAIKQSVNGCIKMAYVDQTIPSCPGTKTVLREWTIVEYCSSKIFKKTQIIKVNDKKGPVVTCPPNITVSADLPQCKGTVNLPQATATDDCSGVESITPSWKFGTGYGPFQANAGTHIVTYTAKDKCGNTGTCTMTVTVVDNVPPTVIGKTNLTVSLTVGGMAFVPATTINDGSYDNCCIDKFEVRRMDEPNAPFGPQVKFQCDDAGNNVQVILKVTDCNGNANTVMVTVLVQDKLTPQFTFCPADVTVNCGTDLTSLTKYGTPTVIDDCTFTMMYVETPNIDGLCGNGTVTRTWTATDKGGKSAVCVQKITVKNGAPWNTSGTKIVWPQDYTVTACTGNNPLDPNNLPFPYNKPSFKDLDGCTNPLANYKDETFSLNSTTCFKILRKWTVIDWCQYNPNNPNGAGRWEYTQILNVMDNTVPDLFVPKDTVINAITGKTCSPVLVTIPKATAKDCSPNVTITNSFSLNGADASGIYPFGTTVVKFFANDGCGNITQKEMKVTVKDGQKPTPVCFQGFSTTITPTNGPGNGGEAWIFAKILDAGSYDNCTEKKNLKYSFSANVTDTMRQFTCDSLGLRFIRLWVTDESGNQDYCDTYIDIQNNMGACKGTPTQQLAVGGLIQTEEKSNVEKVTTNITFIGSLPIVTDATGKFLFKNIPTGGNYTITPQKDINHINGISTYDVYLINRHILGLQLLTSPYKIIAADVTKDNKITTADVNELRKLVLAINTNFPTNTSWRFVPKSYVFPTPTNPFAQVFPEVIAQQYNANKNDADFVGVKVGDVNASASASGFTSSEARSAKTLSFEVANITCNTGENVRIPFTISQLSDAVAAQFTLNFDNTLFDFVSIDKGNIEGIDDASFNFKNLDAGMISAAWFKMNDRKINQNDVLFYLNVKVKRNTSMADAITIDSRLINAEVTEKNGEVANIELKFGGNTASKFEVYQNQPNPFQQTTTIGYQSPEEITTTLRIYDAAGKEIKTMQQTAVKGYNQFILNKEELNTTGVFIYRIENGKNHAVRKMILMP
jgi:Cohesin domain/HYR domain/Secretion system C-terminal sorting domain